jgi:hypothetical protein
MAKKPGIKTTSTPPGSASGINIDDFVAYLPTGVFIFTPCREPWIGRSVNSILPKVPVLDKAGRPKRDANGITITMAPTTWLTKNRQVIQIVWAPGQPLLIKDHMVVNTEWIARGGVTCFNSYRPSQIKLGDATAAGPWVDHVKKVFESAEAEHIIKWLAHRVQLPGVKINHALVLGGAPGVGKDSLLAPVKYAVGSWNFQDVTPMHLLGDFNPFAKSTILRINEAHDLGELTRFSFYEKTKGYITTPPETVPVNEKYVKLQHVFNCVGIIITTNYKTDGIFLPANDRRHFVAWTHFTEADFPPGYWERLWAWFEAGGFEHVAAYLSTLDLSGFNPKAPPPKTQAFWDIVLANAAPEDGELADLLDELENPKVVTRSIAVAAAKGELAEWLVDRRNRRALPHRMERCGYSPVRNPDAKDGLWKMNGMRQAIYAKAELTEVERMAAARKMVKEGGVGQ